MKILIADDEINILKFMSVFLADAGYEVITATNGSDALDIYYDKHIDMLIIDEMMPIVSGNEVVRTIRSENKDLPIIMVTAKAGIDDKVESFSIGVDDYMVKPIAGKELVMRVGAIFKRAQININKKIVIGDITIDSDTHIISSNSNENKISLTNKEFAILFKLLSYPEKTFTKWQLFNEFWGINSDADETIVKAFIQKIRKKIEPFKEIGIETIMGVGYRGVKHE